MPSLILIFPSKMNVFFCCCHDEKPVLPTFLALAKFFENYPHDKIFGIYQLGQIVCNLKSEKFLCTYFELDLDQLATLLEANFLKVKKIEKIGHFHSHCILVKVLFFGRYIICLG